MRNAGRSLGTSVTPFESAEPATAPSTPAKASVSVPARGTVQLLAGQLCAIACGYAISVILARGLGPADYGVYGVVISVLTAVEMAAGLGVPGATTKLIPERDRDAVAIARTANFVLVVGTLALFVVFWVAAPLLAGLLDLHGGTLLFRVAIVDLPFTGLMFAYRAALYGHRRFGAISVSLAVYGLAKLAGILALLSTGLSVTGALVVNAAATVGAVVYLVSRAPAAGLKPSVSMLGVLLRLAVPMGLYIALLHSLLGIDLWVLKGLRGTNPTVVGSYVAAFNVARVLIVVAAVLAPVVFASVCRALARSDEAMARRQMQGAVRFALMVLAPACALLALNGEEVMVLIYSDAYAGAGTLLALQAWAFAAFAVLDVLLHAAVASGQHRRVVGFLLMLIPLAAVADVILVGRLGALGAALGLAGIMTVGSAGAMALIVPRFGTVVPGATVLRVLTAVVVVVIADHWLTMAGSWIVVKFALLVGVYGVVLLASGELREKDFGAFALWRTTTA